MADGSPHSRILVSNTIVPPTRIREKLAQGQLVVGTMLVEVRQPSIMTLLANAGFDFVLIDNEHGPFSVETIADLSRAARTAGVTPVVRIPELTYAQVTQALDGGAQGIMLPRVTTRRSEEHTSELQSRLHLVCRLLLEKKNRRSASSS